MQEPTIKTRKKRSIIYSFTKEYLESIVKDATSINFILKQLGLPSKPTFYRSLKKRFVEEGIDFSHLKLGLNSNLGRKFPNAKKIPLEDLLVENSEYSRMHLKNRLIKENLLNNKCYICDLGPNWNNKELSLQIDHINGIGNDNRLENLRMLCPNCHTQTDTYAGKNIKRMVCENRVIKDGDPNVMVEIIGAIPKRSKLNPEWRKEAQFKARRVERPSKEELEKLLWEKPTTHIAKDYGVSDKAVEKWAKVYGIVKPPRGYWQKINKS